MEEINKELVGEFTRAEVDLALNQMAPLKAPGPDGMPPLFYQYYWPSIRDEVSEAVLDCLNSEKMPSCLNHTFLTLILKVKSPEKVYDFRPIALFKSGYHALCEEARSDEASSSDSGLVARFWSKIWKPGVSGKVKHFLWRACTDSLPTRINLMKRKILSDLICHLCGRVDEDTLHALWGCEAVKQVWDRDFNWVNQFEVAQGSFQDLVEKVLSKPRLREDFATTAWFVWARRNKSRLNEKTTPLNGIRDAIRNFLQLFHSCREPPVSNKMQRQRNWIPPKPGQYKVNFDGALFNENDEAGVGIVVRDSRGLVVVAMAEKIIKPHSMECLQILATRHAVIFAKEIGLQLSHFVGDSKIVIKGLLGGGNAILIYRAFV
ncbi:uncharacterized protein LOC142605927 [Castanea sativa]|uniref:uncharacterized protein LOC142605927 n=1 Tax=Castanea sativa TaxID=21020 RepID=UPI003F65325F